MENDVVLTLVPFCLILCVCCGTNVVPTKSDSDVIFCLQLLSKI